MHKLFRSLPQCLHHSSQHTGFSLVEIVVAVGISGIVVLAMSQLIVDAIKDDKAQKDTFEKAAFQSSYAKKLRKIMLGAGMSQDFLYIPVSYEDNQNCLSKTHKKGGSCFFASARGKDGKSSRLCPMHTAEGSIPGKILRKIEKKGLRFYADTYKKEIAPHSALWGTSKNKDTQTNKREKLGTISSIYRPHKHLARIQTDTKRYFVGWKLTKDSPLPILRSPPLLPSRFWISEQQHIRKIETGFEHLAIYFERPLLKDKNTDEREKLEKNIAIFHDRNDPRIYTIKSIESIRPCKDMPTKTDCQALLEEGPETEKVIERLFLMKIKKESMGRFKKFFKKSKNLKLEDILSAKVASEFNVKLKPPTQGQPHPECQNYQESKSVFMLQQCLRHKKYVNYYDNYLNGFVIQLSQLKIEGDKEKQSPHKAVEYIYQSDENHRSKTLINNLKNEEEVKKKKKGDVEYLTDQILIGREIGTQNYSTYIYNPHDPAHVSMDCQTTATASQ